VESGFLFDRVDQPFAGDIVARAVGHCHSPSLLLRRAGIAVPTLVGLTGCSGALSTIDPAGPHARSVATLWWVMLGGATILSLLVFVLLALAFRRRRAETPQNPRLWIGALGLAMPSAVLALLLGYALVIGSRSLPIPAAGVVTIEVTARQYAWRFRYPGGQRTENVLHIPAGRPVDLRIRSTDVIHSLWIPRLAGKMDAIPGHTNMLRIEADAPGTYRGECAEYCGIGHKDHGFRIVAHPAAGWAAFTAGRMTATGEAGR